ncbi:MAG TPA: sigma-54-dependent Fis family transcriptional regulator [Acetobacteraceae bacterium]|nr:sigma-54-dependent Fis family transcriptional regulator [Acetobacteraceae bacterium]
MPLEDNAGLTQARLELERRGTVPDALLAPEISESWARCLAAGLDPRQPPRMRIADPPQIREARERHDIVRRLALAEMHGLYHQIAGTNYLIAFAAPDGMLLETLADHTFLTMARRSGICPGGLWDESVRGTNALGTVAATGKPITVHGGEHFFSVFGGLTCTASPVLGPDAKLVGILDASSDCRSRQQHTRALVSMAAMHIENSLFREHHRASLVLAFHSRAEYLRTPSAALIALTPDGTITGSNAQARFLLQGLPVMPGRRFEEVFRTPFSPLMDRARSQDRLLLEDVVGSSFVASAETLGVSRPAPVSQVPRALRPRFVADDPAVRAAVRAVEQAAARRLPILISGPTGTGKEGLARHAHAVSGRPGVFVPVNCAAIPKSLIESELFGHAEGAFTGARRHGARGLVEEADRGTLFLDEIADMPLDLQAVLLRLLDDWTVRPVGGNRVRQVDVLLVAATNADLERRVAAGLFRADLFYRLNTVEIRLPPLAERSDFAALVAALLTECAPGATLTSDALDCLQSMPWPGNIRQLRNMLARLTLASAPREIDRAAVLRLSGRSAPGIGTSSPPSLRASVRARIVAIYYEEESNVSRTARRLGVSRNTVYRALRGDVPA